MIPMVEMNDSQIQPIGRAARSLPEKVAEHLLEAIIAGRIPAGTHLKELALAREHAVSRATIREALIALEKSQFVERIPRSGVRVTELGAEDVSELFEVRGSLLGLAAGRCARTPKPGFISALRHLVDQIEARRAGGGAPSVRRTLGSGAALVCARVAIPTVSRSTNNWPG